LETLAQTKVMAFDKTGTLTYGNFTVLETQVLLGVQNEGQIVDETYVLSLAAALEKSSAHPIAKAFAFVKDLPTVTDVTELAGRGLCGNREGKAVLVGSATLMEENGVQVPEIQSVFTLIYVAENKRLLGVITVGDEVRKEAKTALEQLKKQGISRLVMLTGDKAERAQTLAESVGIDEVFAGLLPEQKLAEAKRLKESGTLSYVGDGINDTPVMAEADCAFSMGKLGSSAAVETSNMVLVGDNLIALAQTVKIAKKTSKVVKQNIVFSIAMKVAFMALGAAGILPLWLAVFADVGVMILAVANALRVKTTR
jgi:Cd2+/Zn2+-exporting ATPase